MARMTPDATRKVDAKKPGLAMASVNGTALTLTFDEDLAAAGSLANSAFGVKKTPDGGAEQTVALSGTAPVISGKTVTLTLGAAVVAGDTLVKVSYTKPSSGSANKLVDARGNEVADFTDSGVDNVLGDSTAPELSGAAVLAADGKTLTVTYNEALKVASIAADSAFTVKATPAGGSEATLALATGGVAVSGSTVVLTLDAPIANDHTAVKVSYTKPGAAPVIEDANGNDAASFTDQEVTNNSLVPSVTIEALQAEATPGIANAFIRLTRSNTEGGALEVTVEYTQDQDYTDGTETFTMAVNQTALTSKVATRWSSGGANLPSGNLTATVAAGDGYVPGSSNTATVAMKMPSSGPPIGVAIVQPAPVVEGSTVTVPLHATTGAGVVKPRIDFTVAIYTEADTATINTDYGHISRNIPFNLAGWRDIGGGVYRHVVNVPIQALDDVERELPEQFLAILQNTPGVPQEVVPNRTPVAITILDDGDSLALSGVSVTSDPTLPPLLEDGPRVPFFYKAGDTISVTAAFSGKVTVTGMPQFEFELGTGAATTMRQATYASGTGTTGVVLSYTVVDGDQDLDGISWAANSLTLNGGTIHFASTQLSEQVVPPLFHGAMASDVAHRVDARKLRLDTASVNARR